MFCVMVYCRICILLLSAFLNTVIVHHSEDTILPNSIYHSQQCILITIAFRHNDVFTAASSTLAIITFPLQCCVHRGFFPAAPFPCDLAAGRRTTRPCSPPPDTQASAVKSRVRGEGQKVFTRAVPSSTPQRRLRHIPLINPN